MLHKCTNGFPTIYATSMTHGKVWTMFGRMLTASRSGVAIGGRLSGKLVVVFVDVPCLVSNVNKFGKQILASVEVALWALEVLLLVAIRQGLMLVVPPYVVTYPVEEGSSISCAIMLETLALGVIFGLTSMVMLPTSIPTHIDRWFKVN